MADDQTLIPYDNTDGGTNPATSEPPTTATGNLNVDPARAHLVTFWRERIRKSKAHFNEAFKWMRRSQQIAAEGDDEKWVKEEKYVAPVLVRHVNYVVDKLYARNPTASAQPKRKLRYELWDGTSQSATMAMQMAQPQPTGIVGPNGMPVVIPGDPMAKQIVEEIKQVQAQIEMEEKLGETLEILWDYFTSEQRHNFKKRLKKLVRRTKINGIAFVKIDFQRALQPRPDVAAEIDDITSKLASAEEIIGRGQMGMLAPEDPEVEQLKLTLEDLESQPEQIVREGVVFAFPRSTAIIVDIATEDLETFAGCDWLAIEYEMTPEKIKSIYDKDVSTQFRAYRDRTKDENTGKARVYEIWDRKNRQVSTICEGYPDFLREPASPIMTLDRFYPIFSLVFNGIEHEEKLYPPSDVYLARHAQRTYNTAREGLDEHREANRPFYVGASGVLEEKDQRKLAEHASFEYIELNVAMTDNFDIGRLVQRGPSIPIDPNMYEVNPMFEDIQRTVGSQEANFGGATGATATESTIAEGSQSAGLASNVDSLDDLLSDLAQAFSHIALMELDVETVKDIVGPGAVWPDAPPTREQVSKDLTLTVKAGSSGRPNRAAELANMERGMPFIVQFPNLNPTPVLKKYLELLDIDVEGAIAEGAKSITAQNAIAGGGGGQPGTGDPATDPDAQGPEGANNAPQGAGGAPGPQGVFPAGMPTG